MFRQKRTKPTNVITGGLWKLLTRKLTEIGATSSRRQTNSKHRLSSNKRVKRGAKHERPATSFLLEITRQQLAGILQKSLGNFFFLIKSRL
ncbi:unknown protein [Desulfotalea psychrophila LSv54]|uniref:Uncharacterized protein n=1 Tax=Desulfotalea psychrophila (strain LSv54 / DSM 12343) TaxID=177439 RepID=Q6AIH6_DESPS|nr:unknown protein [Desulfotalea psychrophila LSv54]